MSRCVAIVDARQTLLDARKLFSGLWRIEFEMVGPRQLAAGEAVSRRSHRITVIAIALERLVRHLQRIAERSALAV